MSVNTIRDSKNRLKQMGLIDFKVPEKASRGIDGQTKYFFPLTVSNNDTVIDTVVDTVPDTVIDTVVDTVPDTNSKLNKTKQNRVKKDFDLDFVDIAFVPLVRDFIEYRKEIKKPFKTPRGVKQFYNELIKLSGNNYQKAKMLVDHAKGKEWQTVYEIKTNETNKRNFGRKDHHSERL